MRFRIAYRKKSSHGQSLEVLAWFLDKKVGIHCTIYDYSADEFGFYRVADYGLEEDQWENSVGLFLRTYGLNSEDYSITEVINFLKGNNYESYTGQYHSTAPFKLGLSYEKVR